MGNNILVTGAGGTVGRYIINYLLEEGIGDKIIITDLEDVDLTEFESCEKVIIKKGDLTDREFIREVTKGVHKIIHTAALLDISKSYKELYPINVASVKALLEEGVKDSLEFFLLFSSGSIYKQTGKILKEDSPLEAYSPYEQTKIDAESVLREFIKNYPQLNWAIIRPSLIYGPRGRFLAAPLVTVPPMLYLITGGKIPGFKGGVKANWVHAEDVGRASVFILKNPSCWNDIYNIADDTPLSFGEIVTSAIKAYGFEPHYTITFPPPNTFKFLKPFFDNDLFFYLLNNLARLLWNYIVKRYKLEKGIVPYLDRTSINYGTQDVIFDNSKLKEKGFSYKYNSIMEGYRDVIGWYVERRLIPRYEEILEVGKLRFSFSEVMSGELSLFKERVGEKLPISFSITVKAKDLRELFSEIECDIVGIISVGEVIKESDLSGKLYISLFKKRTILYSFEFCDKKGDKYSFRGVKKLSWLSPIDSITNMEIEIEKGGELWAKGEMKFDIKHDFVPFLASFSL